jgi:hypothetical protein
LAGNYIEGFVDVYIDTSPPNIFIPNANPDIWTANTQPVISFFTTDDISSIAFYNISIDQGAFSTQTSPYTLPTLNDGVHNITVRAYDVVGNFIEGFVEVYIDTTAPDAFTPLANPSSWTVDNQPIIIFSTLDNHSGIDHYELKIDNGTFTIQTSPYTLPSQNDGIYNITVRAFDNAGNFVDGYVFVYIDTSNPGSFTPTANPSSWTSNTQPEISFSANDGISDIDHYEVSVDGSGFSVQASPYTLPDQIDGLHNVTVRAFDLAGNYIEEEITVYIDTVPPVISHTPVTSGTKGESIIIAASVTDDHSGVGTVTLYFKKQNEVIYSSIQMILDENIYSAEISSATVNTDFIEYYIKAVDNSMPSNVAYFGMNGRDVEVPTTINDIDISLQDRDTTRPEVYIMSPSGTDALVDSIITITFSEIMIMNVTEEAFSISPYVKGNFDWVANSGTILEFNPDILLDYDTEYTVTISTDAKDLAGNDLERYNSTFKTEKEPSQDGGPSFWDTWEPIITGATVLASVLVFLIGFLSIRRKRNRLRVYLDEIDDTYNENKNDSQKCHEELTTLREEIRDEVKGGKLEENHFLILDKKIDDYLQQIKTHEKSGTEAGTPYVEGKSKEDLKDVDEILAELREPEDGSIEGEVEEEASDEANETIEDDPED